MLYPGHGNCKAARRDRKDCKKRVNISLDPDIHEMLKKFAAENHMNVSQYVTHLVLGENNSREFRKFAIKEGLIF